MGLFFSYLCALHPPPSTPLHPPPPSTLHLFPHFPHTCAGGEEGNEPLEDTTSGWIQAVNLKANDKQQQRRATDSTNPNPN